MVVRRFKLTIDHRQVTGTLLDTRIVRQQFFGGRKRFFRFVVAAEAHQASCQFKITGTVVAVRLQQFFGEVPCFGMVLFVVAQSCHEQERIRFSTVEHENALVRRECCGRLVEPLESERFFEHVGNGLQS